MLLGRVAGTLVASRKDEGLQGQKFLVVRELGLEKDHDPLGRPRYVLPERASRLRPGETLATLLAQFGRRATAAGNIVVVRAEIGSAPAIARALDRLEHADIVGTLAGDDTCLVVAADEPRAQSLADELTAKLR